jgi:predicted RNA polymerase sigma factor
VLRLLGKIEAYQAAPTVEPAEEHYRQASAIADALKMRPLLAHCHLERGTFYRRLGRREAARAELSTAIDLYRAMEMAFWLSRAEAELTQVA